MTKAVQSKNIACVDQVPYVTTLGLPAAAMVNSEGRADNCESGNAAGMEQFGVRYRRYCINGIKYVKFIVRYSENMFVEFDPSTRLPMPCGAEPNMVTE